MVLVHFPENLSGYIPPFTGFGAPLFTFLSGVSYRLWLNGQARRGVDESEVSKISIRRGLFVFGVGVVYVVFVWLPQDIFNWDVLTFIGAAILVLNLLRNKPLEILIAMVFAILIISPALRAAVDYPSYWQNYYFDPDLTLSDLLIGFFVAGYFPMFPWLIYPIVGFVSATLLFPCSGDDRPSVWPFVQLGVGLIVLSLVGLQFGSLAPQAVTDHMLTGWKMFPSSLEYQAGTIGIALAGLGLLHQFLDRRNGLDTNSGPFLLFKTFSRYAFTIYLLHHVVHVWPLWIYGMLSGVEATTYWRKAMPVSVSMSLGVLFLVICYYVLRRLNPNDRYGIEGWMRWLCG